MYNHTPEAISAREGSTWQLDDTAAAYEWSGVGVATFLPRNRDSDSVYESNFHVAYDGLVKDHEGSVAIVRLGHWAVGWIEWIVYDSGNEAACADIEALRAKVEDYPILDEMHWSELDWSNNHHDGKCWDADCDCDAPPAYN